MAFKIILSIVHKDGEILNPIVIQFVVALTTALMVTRFVLDALRHRSTGKAMRMTLIVMDAVTQALTIYSLGIMQRPSDKDYYYKVWAVLLVTLRYSVKIGRPAGIALKQTPLVDLMSSFWSANILRSKAPRILKVTGWLLWSVNSLRIIYGFISSEFANDSHREDLRLLTEYMRHEHEAGGGGDGDPVTMKGYRYLVRGEAKKRKMKKNETGGQARDTGMVEETGNIRRLLLALREEHKEILTLEKIWEEPADPADALDEELKDLCLSFALYKLLRRRFFNFGIHEAKLKRTRRLVLDGILGEPCNSERAFRVSEAELSFLNDFFNSRHAIVFAKGFPFIRLLLSTILIGGIGGMAVAIYSFSKVGTRDELGNVHGGVTFTWFLLSFLFVKETWEITTYVFSDWTKIILLCQYVQKPWWLRSPMTKDLVRKLCRLSVPWLPRWHGKVGQCNILFPSCFVFPTNLFFPERCSRYFVHLSQEVKHTVINCLRDCLAEDPPRLDNYLERAFGKVGVTDGFRANFTEVVNGVKDSVHILLIWHIATCYCEIDLAENRKVSASMYWSGQDFGRRKPSEGDSDLLWSQYMIARTLSQYCAYVLTLVPPLVPGNSLMARSVLIKVREEKSRLFNGKFNSCAPCYQSTQMLGRLKKYASEEIELYKKKVDGGKQDEENQDGKKEENLDDTILKKGADLGKKMAEAFSGDKPEDLWRFLSEFWAGFVIHLAASTRASQHKIFLSSGGEFITHLWALLTHAGILGDAQHGDQDFDTALTQEDVYDQTVQS
ncbi:hypothetical protein VPH35_004885 [Triticum aestivum]|uniref:uncharacterized protein n=1 Tax=Triticum aestivum TaxID=4565 RepID=UPI000842FD9D|nr:uncharacterized protein LOC123068496 [Triticum aestivum]XP_044347024.1 uncharacterized protein LOC123068496 [Triticum aestivum]